MEHPTATVPKPAPTITAYGLPERKDPLRMSYLLMTQADGNRRKPGDVFRDPTNGKVYLVAPDGSLRRANLSTHPDGTHTATSISRRARRRQR